MSRVQSHFKNAKRVFNFAQTTWKTAHHNMWWHLHLLCIRLLNSICAVNLHLWMETWRWCLDGKGEPSGFKVKSPVSVTGITIHTWKITTKQRRTEWSLQLGYSCPVGAWIHRLHSLPHQFLIFFFFSHQVSLMNASTYSYLINMALVLRNMG